jgi:hypothetical protein
MKNVILPAVALLLLAGGAAPSHAQPGAAERERAAADVERAQRETALARERAERERTANRERAERESTANRERAERERAAAAEQARRQADVETDLERAREQMENAAREVARLSAEIAGPIVKDVTRRFRYAGQRAMLGVNIEDTELGVRVAGVSPNGPAAAAGIAIGDTIVAVEGAELADTSSSNFGGARRSPSELLLAQMANVDPGEEVELRILRAGDYRDVMVRTRDVEPGQFFGAPPPNFSFSFPGPSTWKGMFDRSSLWADMQLAALTPALGAYFGTDKGLLVLRGPGNDALGLRDVDVILDIGGREPNGPEHALRILASFERGETLRIAIMREQRRQVLELQIPLDPAG